MNITSILNELGDTLIFEYNCTTDVVSFLPNAPLASNLPNVFYLHDDSLPMQESLHPLEKAIFACKESTDIVHTELCFVGADGINHFYLCSCKAILNQNQEPDCIIGKFSDISERLNREQTLIRLSRTDLLTGLYNRSGEQLIQQKLSLCCTGTLFMIDLNKFKAINDTYGHSVGDDVLVAVSQVLKHLFRPNDLIARVGGDEFVVYMEGCCDACVAQKKAQELLEKIQAIRIEHCNLPIGASIGIALAPMHGSTYVELHHTADYAMYQCKRSKTDCYSLSPLHTASNPIG